MSNICHFKVSIVLYSKNITISFKFLCLSLQGNLPPMRGPDPCAVQDATKQSKSSTKKAPTSAG